MESSKYGTLRRSSFERSSSQNQLPQYNFAIQAGSIIPTFGVYGDATIANAGGSTLVTPSVIPSGTNFTAYTTTNFKGTLVVNNTTGVLSITNAHPAGNYTVTVNALGVLYNFKRTVSRDVVINQSQFCSLTCKNKKEVAKFANLTWGCLGQR